MKKSTIIQNAAEFAEKAHAGQTRRNGEPYYNHVHRVALLASELTDDEEIVAAAYLHDTMEDCGTRVEELDTLFGSRVAGMVQELTNNEAMLEELGKEEYMVRKLSAMSSDALLVKLCDTLNNMTETDRAKQAGTYARIQQRLQHTWPQSWNDTHLQQSERIMAIYYSKFGE